VAADLLEPLRTDPRSAALIFDVDGTLAPIVARPELAEVPAGTKAELRRLAGTYLVVACLSGRPGEEAARLVGVEGIRYVGNHGLELHPEAAAFTGRMASFRDSIGRPVEDKELTLSYHFREAPDEAAARAELERVADEARAAGLVPRWGRKVLEIRPPVDADKGTAVRTLLDDAGATRGLYAGDDATDVDAFAGLRAARLEYALRLAIASGEAPAELVREADLVLEGPAELAKLLAGL
jgi:trehalose 6-phosphate phosphatase